MAGDILESVVFKTVTIADGASLSDAENIQGYDLVSLQQPANCEGIAFSFQGSVDGITFADLYDVEGAEITVTKSATLAQTFALKCAITPAPSPIVLEGLQAVKVRTGLTAAATNQTGAVVILLGLRKVN
jgi:hypothetical protein